MQTNYKTLVPAIVGLGVLLYESVSGHKINEDVQTQIVNGSISFVGWGFALWGIYKNHKTEVKK